MPEIDPNLVPTITPGNIFERLTTDTSINIRWLVSTDPVLAEVMNRPIADLALRQLIIAKALDDINLRISHQALFPFLIPAKVEAGSAGAIELPGSWIWDMHVSIPAKWEYLRLARVKRISGTNIGGSGGDEVTGILRFVFSAQQVGSTTEAYLFYVDYQLDSFFTYQIKPIQAATTEEESNPIDSGEIETIAGYVVFRTLDRSDTSIEAFLKALAPPSDTTDSNSDGIYDSPAVYNIVATPPGGISQPDDFLAGALNHGTGILVNSAWNSIPATDSDFNSWLTSSNFPFRVGASRNSIQGITVPSALFREFSLVVPAYDEESGDLSLQNHPIWLSSIERLDDLASKLQFRFSTHSIDENDTPTFVEFASLDLEKSMEPGTIVNIRPINDLLESEIAEQENFRQGFGNGHVVLSSIWGSTTDEVDNFFEGFLAILDSPPVVTYTKESGILSNFGLDRNSVYTPTKGNWYALQGSSARRSSPLNPSDSNRYVTEADEGLGEPIDFRTKAGFPDDLRENPDIEPIGYAATNVHKLVKLVVDASKDNHEYERDILPRLVCLLGRDPIFGDIWFDGSLFKFNSGDAWVSL